MLTLSLVMVLPGAVSDAAVAKSVTILAAFSHLADGTTLSILRLQVP